MSYGDKFKFKFIDVRRPDVTSGLSLTGFTLIELVSVIGIILILIAIGIPAYNSWINRSNVAKAKATIAQIEMALEMYKSDFGSYPPEGEDLNNPANPINRIKNYLAPYMKFKQEDLGSAENTYATTGHILLDPWGRYYTVLVYNSANAQNYPADFVFNKTSYFVYSRGPDGIKGDMVKDVANSQDVDNDNIDNYYK
jgi:type II secretion system protein G